MTAYNLPGVYPSIKDSSGIVANNLTTSVGYVGESEFGPVFKPTLCSNLQDFVSKFGKLNSRYGYAGYSLAVAAETIAQHHFVRVVPTGSEDEPASERATNAKWAYQHFTRNDAGSNRKFWPETTGYFYEEITAAEEARDAGLDSGLFKNSFWGGGDDYDSAFIIAATNPNNRKFFISIADSTINPNKAYPLYTITPTVILSAITYSDGSVHTRVSMYLQYNGFSRNDEPLITQDNHTIYITGMENSVLNGAHELNGWSYHKNSSDTVNGGFVLVNFDVDGEQTYAGEAKARVAMYPEDTQTTFSVTVSEKVGRVYSTLEVFQYCTLYPAQDSYGNSMYIEDVINGSSQYIQVFVNHNYENWDIFADNIIVPFEYDNLELTGGQAGTWSSIDEKYTALCNAWDLFKDRTQINVTLLANSGYVLKNNTSYQSKMLEVAELRRDCFCLFDCPMTETSYDALSDWRRNIQGMHTYRAALCAPWIKTYDSVQGRANFVMCPSAYVAKIMGSSDPWMAPAGLNRGVLTAAVVSPTGLTQIYDDTTAGNLYTNYQVNCILRNAAVGYVNWGQRTLQQKPSALDRINVARTVIYIETILRDAARWKVFENNNAETRMQITLQFSSFLDTILSADGINSYRVICDTSNNTPQIIANNQLKIDVYLVPAYCAEVILIQSTIEGALTTTTVSTTTN